MAMISKTGSTASRLRRPSSFVSWATALPPSNSSLNNRNRSACKGCAEGDFQGPVTLFRCSHAVLDRVGLPRFSLLAYFLGSGGLNSDGLEFCSCYGHVFS